MAYNGELENYSSNLIGKLLEGAISEIEQDKKQIVDDMFSRLDKENKSDFEQYLSQKAESFSNQTDHYQSEMNNSALTEKQRMQAQEQYERLLEEQRQLEEAKARYEQLKTDEEAQMLRYSFSSQQEYEQFAEIMAEQNVYVNTSDAQVNGCYICEVYQQDQMYTEATASNNDWSMHLTEDYSNRTDKIMGTRSNTTEYMEVSQSDYANAYRSQEYYSTQNEPLVSYIDGSVSYFHSRRMSEEEFNRHYDGSDKYRAITDDSGNTFYFQKNEVAKSEYDTFVPQEGSVEALTNASRCELYKMEIDALGKEHYYKKIEETDRYDFKTVDDNGQTHYWNREVANGGKLTSGDRADIVDNFFGVGAFGNSDSKTGNFAMNLVAGEAKVLTESQNMLLGVARTAISESANEGAKVVTVPYAVIQFLDEAREVRLKVAENGGEMPEEYKIFHPVSKETLSLQASLSADKLVQDEELKAFMKDMSQKYATDLSQGLMSPSQLITVNAMFIQKHADLVVVNGKVDFSKLAMMTETQLKAYGIMLKERDFIVNADKALRLNGKADMNNVTKLLTPVMKVLEKFNGSLELADDDLEEARQNIQKTTNGGKKVYEKSKDVTKVIKEKKERQALKKATKGGKKANKATKKVTTEAGKKVQNEVAQTLVKKHAEQYTNMMVAKMSEKFVFLQKLQALQVKALQTIGQTTVGSAISSAISAVSTFVTGTLIGCVGIACLIFLTLAVGVVIIICIFTGITSLWEVYTGQSVCEKMAYFLQDEEEDWFNNLLDTGNLWEHRADYLYSHYYRPYTAYVGAGDAGASNSDVTTYVEGLYYTSDQSTEHFYISPWKCTVQFDPYCKCIDDEGFTVDGTDGDTLDGIGGGGYVFELDCNYNLAKEAVYDEATGEWTVAYNEGYGFAKSGHTSNIKDIIAMADVMFGLDQQSADDNTFSQSITDSNFDLTWTNFQYDCVSSCKFIGAVVSSFWEEEAWIKFEDWSAENSTTTYKHLQEYCMGLFEASHQEKIFWEVVFLPIKGEADHTVVWAENAMGGTSEVGSYLDNEISLNGNHAEYCPASEFYDETQSAHWGCLRVPLYMYTDAQYVATGSSSGSYQFTYKGLGLQSGWGNGSGIYKDWQTNCWSNQPHLDFPADQEHEICIAGISSLSDGVGSNVEGIRNQFENKVKNSDWSAKDCWTCVVSGEEIGTYLGDSYTAGTSYASMVTQNTYTDSVQLRMSNTDDWNSYATGDESETRHLFVVIYRWQPSGTITRGCTTSSCHYGDSYSCSDPNCLDNHTYADHNNGCRAGETVSLWNCTRYVYKHTCQGHYCHLCGGHLLANIHGIVYSMTDEQWFHFSGQSVGQMLPDEAIEGKVYYNGETIEAGATGEGTNFYYDYTSLNTYNRTGRRCFETSLDGINLNVVNDTWEHSNLFRIDRLQLAQDIFDIDLAILYGYGQFPIVRYRDYTTWDSENMEMACAKASADWNDYYDFDIPTNIMDADEMCLGDSDISRMVGWISWTYEATYGSPLPEERRMAVELALQSVGRGNYSQAHHGHGYYLNPCGVDHSASAEGHYCNKTDCSGFASYIYGMVHGTTDVYSSMAMRDACTNTWDGNWETTAKPGDILILDGTESDLGWHAVVYCGYIDLPACTDAGLCDMADETWTYEISSGMEIGQRVPITVDCTIINNKGNIYLQNCVVGGLEMSYLNDLHIMDLMTDL